MGNYSNQLVNHILQETNLKVGYIHPISLARSPLGPHHLFRDKLYQDLKDLNQEENYQTGIEAGSSKEIILTRIQPHTRVLLHHKVAPQMGQTYGHAVCLKQHNNKWYLIDSEKPGPICLEETPDEEGWGKVYGNLYYLADLPPLLKELDPNWVRDENITINMVSPTPIDRDSDSDSDSNEEITDGEETHPQRQLQFYTNWEAEYMVLDEPQTDPEKMEGYTATNPESITPRQEQEGSDLEMRENPNPCHTNWSPEDMEKPRGSETQTHTNKEQGIPQDQPTSSTWAGTTITNNDHLNTDMETSSDTTDWDTDTITDTDIDTDEDMEEPITIPPEIINHTHIAMPAKLMPQWWKWTGKWKGDTQAAWEQKMAVCRELVCEKDDLFSNKFSWTNNLGRHHTGQDLKKALFYIWPPGAPPPMEFILLQYAERMRIRAITHIKQGTPSRWNVHWEPINLPNHVAEEWCEKLGLTELTKTPTELKEGQHWLEDFSSTVTWAPTLMMEDDILQIVGKKQLDRLTDAWNNRTPPPRLEKQPVKPKTFKQTLLTDHQPKKSKTEKTTQPTTLPKSQQPIQPQLAGNQTEVVTINCRGIRTNWESIYTALKTLQTIPEVIILTETKLTSSSMRRMKGAVSKDMHDYNLHHSSTPDTPGQATRGRGGVIILIHKLLGPITKIETQTNLAGALTHITLDRPEGHTHIMGVYMPAEEPQMRQAVYDYIKAHTTVENTYLLVGGDWNAAIHPGDRSTNTLNTMDTQHQSRTSLAQLFPTNQNPKKRPHTYYSYQDQQLIHSSRIDDILMHPQPPAGTLLNEECILMGGTLDHHMLRQSLHTPITKHKAPTEKQRESPPTLILPISQEHRNLTRRAITLQLPTLTQLTQPIEEAYASTMEALAGNYTPANLATHRAQEAGNLDMETMGANIMAAIRKAHDIMLSICPKKPPLTGNFLPRQVAKEFKKQNSLAKQLKQARQAVAAHQGEDLEDIKSSLLQNTQHMEAIPTVQQIPTDPALLPEWKTQLGEQIKATINKLETIRLSQAKERSEAAQEAFRTKLSKQPKVVHRSIFGPDNKPDRNLILRDTKGTLHSSTEGILDTLTHHMQNLMAPANHTRTGKYLPQERSQANQNTPWETDKLDPIKMSTPAQELQHSTELLNILMDRCTYLNCIRHLARNKQPGPDGIPNELLTCLPDSLHTTIHKLFTLMWITGQTPTCLQNSHTLSLYKKGDPTNPANYRPIGLSNTMGKLWTSLVSTTLAHFSEYTGILSSAQEGFRANKGTHRQLTNLIHIIEDAALTNQDLYIAYFDFSSAFNMVDHDKLLCTMYDLGYPTDAIDAVKGIYHGATTHMVANGGQGPAIPIERGTIQGDSLSPLLFLIFIEPLHRWLQAGGRGYRFGSVPQDQQDQCCTGSLGYADDTTAITHTAQDLQVQCNKVQAFSVWAGIPLNPQKCEITGILHRTSQSNPTCPTTLKAILHNHITLGGAFAKYVPPTEPCMYLGIKICPTLDWKPQVQHMMNKIHTRGEHILTRARPAGATPQQCLRLIKTCLIPQITYTMAVTPYMPADIGRMDTAIGAIIKKSCNLPRGFPTAALRLPHEEAGMDMPSLQLDYLQVTTATLTRALNDKGTLGTTTHALLHLQHQRLQELDPHQLPRQATRYLTIMRQLHILKQADVQLQVNDTPTLQELNKSINKMDTLTPQHIPDALLYPLYKLGITDHTQLINREGTHLITTQELTNTWTKAGHPVTKSQKKALNRISLIISGRYPPNCYLEAPSRYTGVESLPAQCRKLPQPVAAMPTPVGQHTIPSMMAKHAGKVAGPAHQTGHPPPPPQPPPTLPERKPTRARSPKLCLWWMWEEEVPGWQQDTTEAWDAKVALCNPCIFNSTFARKHKLTKNCTGKQLRNAVLNSTAELPPPKQVLVLTYAHQFKIERISGMQAKRDYDGEFIRDWKTHWAPIQVLKQHAEACHNLGFPLQRETQQPGNPYCTLHWTPLTLDEVTIEEITGEQGYQQLRNDFANHPKETPPPAPRRDMHLTERQQQGCWQETATYQAAALRLARQKITLDPSDCHPDFDIAPPGQYHLQTGLQLPGQPLKNTQTGYLYDPAGRCIGTLPLKRLQHLHGAYEGTRQRDPDQHAKMGGTNFETDLAHLLTRSRPQPKTATSPQLGQTLHPLLTACFSQLAVHSAELFTCPLNYSTYHAEYCSEQEADQLFGACPTPYSKPWTGVNIVHPTQDGKAIHKAMRWAIASAQNKPHIPTCTILAVPRAQQQAYSALINHQNVHILDDIPGGINPLQPQDAQTWAGGKLPPMQIPNNRHTLVLAITNTAGMAQILKPAYPALQNTWRQATAQLPGTQGARTLQPITHTSQPGPPVQPPKALRPLLQGNRKERTAPTPPPTATVPMQHALPTKPKAGRQIYTDGSEIKTPNGPSKIGAGVYVEGIGSILINPGGEGCTRTNNRAELVAIHMALQDAPLTDTVTIYTDSLCSIQSIRKMIDFPMRMTESKHKELLESIARLLMSRAQQQSTTQILKVRSHSGIKGNDEADAIAKKAAMAPHLTILDPVGQQAYRDMTWPTTPGPTETSANSQPGPPPRRTTANLTKAIKTGATRNTRLGNAKTDGIYAQNWEKTAPTLHKESSNFWHLPIPWSTKITTHRLRWGHFWNRKLAYRYGLKYAQETSPPTSCTCPICHQGPDGGSHILAGCRHPNMTGAYINRHDKAVKAIQGAITKGEMGNCTIFMDAGAQADLPVAVQAKRLPEWLRPATVTPETWKKMRPDILLLPNLTDGATPPQGTRHIIHIVEVGYCSDTNHEVKLMAKAQQHQQLVTALREANHTVHMHLITLGTTGTIRQDTLNTLRDLGVAGDHAPRLLRKLHANAIHYVSSITAMRRHMEWGDGQPG